jgi:hypothetical protein
MWGRRLVGDNIRMDGGEGVAEPPIGTLGINVRGYDWIMQL